MGSKSGRGVVITAGSKPAISLAEHEARPMDESAWEPKEPAFGVDFAQVRVHHGGPAPGASSRPALTNPPGGQAPVLQMDVDEEEELAFAEAEEPGLNVLSTSEDDDEQTGTTGMALQQDATSRPADPRGLLRRGQTTVSAAHQSLPHAEQIQRSFGQHDLSGVRAVVGGPAWAAARALGARAFTTGERIAFRGSPDLHLAAHEAAHVVQQRQGVHLPDGVGRPGDAYERLANRVADAVVAGRSAESLLDGGLGRATSFSPRSPAARTYQAASALQMQSQQPKPDLRKTHVRRSVIVTQTVDQEGFKKIALQSLFGGAPPVALEWKLTRTSYGPENNPVTLWVDVSLIKAQRSQTNAGKGVEVGQGGEVAGSKQRAQRFLSGKPTQTKADLMAEIDRRYFEATGSKEKIKSGERGNIDFWNQIRDEVLFQNEYIQNLPPQVKMLIKESTDGRPITAKDIEQLFRIAKMIEGMDPGDVADYHSRVRGTTKDLDAFESSVKAYLAQKKQREEDNEKREEIQTKLYGHGDLFDKYKRWKGLQGNHIPAADEFGVEDPNATYFREKEEQAERELIAALAQAKLGTIADFEKYMADFLAAFEKEAQRITLDILEKYQGTLYQEGQRYKDLAAVTELHGKLGPFRSHYRAFAKHAEVNNARARWEQTPGPDFTKGFVPPTRAEADEARVKAEAEKQAAIGEVQGLSGNHPLLKEDRLPVERRLDKQKMATSTPEELRALIAAHIAARMADAEEAKGHIVGDPALIYKLTPLMPEFYAKMGIPPGEILDKIIQDKIGKIERDKTVVNVLLTLLAIALAIVSYGVATPLVGAVAAGGGLLISSYFAYDELQEYIAQKDLADVGFAQDPSLFWLVVAIAGAALDAAAALKAVKALGSAASKLKISQDFNEFVRAIRKLEDAGVIEAKIAQAAEKAALAKQAGKEAA
ncbi:MAG TPA: DUF4157 domain-containing protein, partial [Polyangium sp.]|nr:DUF4157 domain-containing protein [Polyangium sp.]